MSYNLQASNKDCEAKSEWVLESILSFRQNKMVNPAKLYTLDL